MAMRKLAGGVAALLMSMGLVVPAAAQDVSGNWQCRLGNQTVSNNAFENWIYEFGLALYGNGTFQAQGNYTAQTNGFSIPFYAEGRWRAEQGGVVAEGSQQQQGGYTSPFHLAFSIVGPRSMSHRFESASGIMASYCER